MKAKMLKILLLALIATTISLQTAAQQKDLVVRIAKLEIDPSHLDKYKAALKEEIEASIRIEAGVLTLYAVADKDNPNQITIMEIYANAAAYQAHLQTDHFKKYKSRTKDMIKSLELAETTPIALGTKPDVKNKLME